MPLNSIFKQYWERRSREREQKRLSNASSALGLPEVVWGTKGFDQYIKTCMWTKKNNKKNRELKMYELAQDNCHEASSKSLVENAILSILT